MATRWRYASTANAAIDDVLITRNDGTTLDVPINRNDGITSNDAATRNDAAIDDGAASDDGIAINDGIATDDAATYVPIVNARISPANGSRLSSPGWISATTPRLCTLTLSIELSSKSPSEGR